MWRTMLKEQLQQLFHSGYYIHNGIISSSVKLLSGQMIAIIYLFSWREIVFMNYLESLRLKLKANSIILDAIIRTGGGRQ